MLRYLRISRLGEFLFFSFMPSFKSKIIGIFFRAILNLILHFYFIRVFERFLTIIVFKIEKRWLRFSNVWLLLFNFKEAYGTLRILVYLFWNIGLLMWIVLVFRTLLSWWVHLSLLAADYIVIIKVVVCNIVNC